MFGQEGRKAIDFLGLKGYRKCEDTACGCGLWHRRPSIEFDPSLKPQFVIRRQSAHDGTLLFSHQLMLRALTPLFDGSAYFKPMGEPPQGVRVRYVIGRIKRMSACGMVKVPAGKIFGERERVVIPVRCEYVPAEDLIAAKESA